MLKEFDEVYTTRLGKDPIADNCPPIIGGGSLKNQIFNVSN